MLCIGQMLGLHASGLEALAVVAALLHVSDRRTEECGTILLGDGKQGNFVIEGDELLHDNLHDVASATLAGTMPGFLQPIGTIHLALSVSAAAHERFDDAGKTYLLCSLHQFFVGVGIAVIGGAQAQFGVCQFAYLLAVHGEVDGSGTGHHLYATALALIELLGANGLYLGYDDVGMHFIHHAHQFVAVQHVEHPVLVGHLHGWRTVIFVASHHILAQPLACNNKLLAQFA